MHHAGLPPCTFAAAVPNNVDRLVKDLVAEVNAENAVMVSGQEVSSACKVCYGMPNAFSPRNLFAVPYMSCAVLCCAHSTLGCAVMVTCYAAHNAVLCRCSVHGKLRCVDSSNKHSRSSLAVAGLMTLPNFYVILHHPLQQFTSSVLPVICILAPHTKSFLNNRIIRGGVSNGMFFSRLHPATDFVISVYC